MAKVRESIAQLQVTHFAKGETMDSRLLEDYKLAYEQAAGRRTICGAIVIGGLVAMVIVLSLISGLLGYIIGGVVLLISIGIAIYAGHETSVEAKKAFAALGITRAELKAAIETLEKGEFAYEVKKTSDSKH